MAVAEIATINFSDTELGEDAVAIVRAGIGMVLLALSLRSDGDIEVGMSIGDCERLIEALQRAVALANRPATEETN